MGHTPSSCNIITQLQRCACLIDILDSKDFAKNFNVTKYHSSRIWILCNCVTVLNPLEVITLFVSWKVNIPVWLEDWKDCIFLLESQICNYFCWIDIGISANSSKGTGNFAESNIVQIKNILNYSKYFITCWYKTLELNTYWRQRVLEIVLDNHEFIQVWYQTCPK